MRKFSRDRRDRCDSARPPAEMFEEAVPFPEDPTWSMILLKGIDNESRYPKASEAHESLMALEADWKEPTHGTTPWSLPSILKDGIEDSLVDELGCSTAQGMKGVYCFPLNRSDGKTNWSKAVGCSSLVTLQNDGVLFQAMTLLMVDYTDRKNRALMNTDQWRIPARSRRVQGVVHKATPLEMLECGSSWHCEAWNPTFEMPPKSKMRHRATAGEFVSSPPTPTPPAVAPSSLALPDPIRVEEVPPVADPVAPAQNASAACAAAGPRGEDLTEKGPWRWRRLLSRKGRTLVVKPTSCEGSAGPKSSRTELTSPGEKCRHSVHGCGRRPCSGC
jgi:hypothetical protein